MCSIKLVFLTLVAAATAQIPLLGWCPDYQPMANFNMNRFLGQWHEAERYFTVTELGSRCVTTTYEKMPDGRVWVSNEIKNAFTGVKRVIDGQLQVVGRDGEGKLSVKYTSLPVPYETQYTVLDTDYDNYAVMWSCSGVGPVHTQNAWVLTRERLAPGLVLQRAYGVLDKYKISRAFFVKTNQEDCTIQLAPIEAVDPTPTTNPEKDEDKDSKDKDKQKKKNNIYGKNIESVDDEIKGKNIDPLLSAPINAPLSVAELIQSSAEIQKPTADHHENEPKKPEPEPEKPIEEKDKLPQEDIQISPEPQIVASEPEKIANEPEKVEEKPQNTEPINDAPESQQPIPKPIVLPAKIEESPAVVLENTKQELKKTDSKKVDKHVEHKEKIVAEISNADP